MKPFVIGDKRFAFDVTNADDLRRLERAFSLLCTQNNEMTAADGAAMSASEQMRTIFRMYHDFFETLFPGRSAEIVGEEPSVGRAGRAFDRWAAYLRSCVEEEERCDRMMRQIYLGEMTVGETASDGSGRMMEVR
ncbi:MAG: hypothetical protein E7604_01655 [Ruminococcaceae bacterium]|nr:hypothetical protein [Oscillospiraceae bacterium]